jgi:hypothetical protein
LWSSIAYGNGGVRLLSRNGYERSRHFGPVFADLAQPGRLGVPVGYFYEGIGEGPMRPITQRERMRLEVARNFADITNERHQEALTALARALASTH